MSELHSPAEAPVLIAQRYRVRAALGRGGMAMVYHAHDAARGRDVALRRLLPRIASDGHVARLFELEYHSLSQLVHGIASLRTRRGPGGI